MARKKIKRSKADRWWMVGWLPNNEAVYCSAHGTFAKEKDHHHLVELSPSELNYVKAERHS